MYIIQKPIQKDGFLLITFYENENDSQTTSGQENSSNEDESSSYRQGERNQDATNKNAIQRQKSETQFARITQEAFDALIEKLKKPFAKTSFSKLIIIFLIGVN